MANDDGEVTREEFMSYAKHSEFFKGQLDKNRDELTLCQNDPFESSNFWFKRVSHLSGIIFQKNLSYLEPPN